MADFMGPDPNMPSLAEPIIWGSLGESRSNRAVRFLLLRISLELEYSSCSNREVSEP